MYKDNNTETNHKFHETMPSLNPQWHAYNEHVACDFPSLELISAALGEGSSFERHVGVSPLYFLCMFKSMSKANLIEIAI